MPVNTIEPAQPEENTAQQEKLSGKESREQNIETLNKKTMKKPLLERVLRSTMFSHTNTHARYPAQHATANEPNTTANTTPRKVS